MLTALEQIGLSSRDGLEPSQDERAWHTPAPPKRRSRWQRKDKYSQRAVIAAHAEGLSADAPLRVLLASQAFEDRLSAYEIANARAIRAQNRYKRWGWIALALATLAALIAASMLLPISALLPASANRVVSGLQSFANIISLVVVFWLNRSGAIDSWLSTRAEAERLRGLLFCDLISAPAPPGADARRLWQEKVALFNAAHVQYQRNYFASASRRHAARAKSLSLPRWIAFGAMSLAAAIGGLTFFGLWPGQLLAFAPWLSLAEKTVQWQLGLNAMASSLLAYASAHSLINQDERHSGLYRHSGESLDALRASEDKEVEAAAMAGDGARVAAYARAAQNILEVDHRAWQLSRPPRDPISGPPSKIKL